MRRMAAGLELWEYQQVVMHSKYAIVDDSWCLIGTFNANVVSVAFAIEVALVSRLPADTSQAAAQLVQDLAASRIVDDIFSRGSASSGEYSDTSPRSSSSSRI